MTDQSYTLYDVAIKTPTYTSTTTGITTYKTSNFEMFIDDSSPKGVIGKTCETFTMQTGDVIATYTQRPSNFIASM